MAASLHSVHAVSSTRTDHSVVQLTHLEARSSPRLEIGLDVPRVQIGDAHQEARSSEGPEFAKAKQLERGRVTHVRTGV